MKYPQFWKCFGPGLLFAGTAIGVSHLVQSTRAGADAGLAVTGVIFLALILKYPFFEFGPRYAAATGMSLIEGYQRIGRWALWLYVGLTIFSAVIVQSAVILFSSFLLKFVFGLSWSLPVIGGILCAACAAFLWKGQYKALDVAIKVILLLLVCSTLAAAAMIAPRVDYSTLNLWVMDGHNLIVPLAFLLALVGWMPTAIDMSVWCSLWSMAKQQATGVRATVAVARLDFLVGYVGTGVLAFAFVILGAGVMHQAGQSFSPQGTVFATQLIDLYGQTLGEWVRPIVIVAVVTTMLSTSLTVIDGIPRSLERAIMALRRSSSNPTFHTSVGRLYWIILVILAGITVLILSVFAGNLTTMIDFATIMSFLTAPILGYLNLRAVSSNDVPKEHQPGPAMRILAYSGLLFMGGIAATYVVFRF